MAVYSWNFRILQTINAYQKSTQQGRLVRNSLKLDEKFSRGISYSSQIVFFQFLPYTCFSSAICPLQVPGLIAHLHARKIAECEVAFIELLLVFDTRFRSSWSGF